MHSFIVYFAVIVGESAQCCGEVVDPNEVTREARDWRMDIMDNCPRDFPTVLLVNKKGHSKHCTCEADHCKDHSDGKQGQIDQLVGLAINSGFTTWYTVTHSFPGSCVINTALNLVCNSNSTAWRSTLTLKMRVFSEQWVVSSDCC